MDGLSWLLLSWAIVGGLCYLALTRLGVQPGGGVGTPRSPAANGNLKGGTGEWTNDVVNWLFANLHKVPEPLEAWIKSLNEAAKKVTSPTKCEILFEGFGDHSKSAAAPRLSNIRVENGPRDHLTVRSNIHLPLTKLKLVSSQRTPERMIVSNFDANIIDLRGEVEARLACIANQLYVMGCFNGRPEMEIELMNTDPNYQVEVDRALVEDGVRRCLLSAVTNVNLSETSLPVGDRSSIPRMSPHFGNASAASYLSSTGYSDLRDTIRESFSSNHHSPNHSTPLIQPVGETFKKINEPSSKLMSTHNSSVNPNKLRVGVLKAARLGGLKTNVREPYVVIEMDEPPQKYATTKSLNGNPYWEETFDFDLTPASEEILFEVYDGDSSRREEDKKFLGLAIVNFEEIRRSGEAVHILKLQGRPYHSDEVDGMLTCRFDFYYDPAFIVPGKTVDKVTIKRNDGSEFRETVSTTRRPIYDPHDDFEHDATKTTTISVKASDRQPPRQQSSFHSADIAHTEDYPYAQKVNDKALAFEPETRHNGPAIHYDNRMSSVSEPEAVHLRVNEELTEETRGRGREKENGTAAKRDRSFFSDLKQRLSGRGRKPATNRARSVDVPTDDMEEAVSLPPSRDHSQTRWAGADGKNRRYFETTSLGGRSGESTKSLYQHSTLLLEVLEGGEKKYFLIPPALLNEPSAVRLLKKGKKLHIYNEHTFVAVKIKGGALCNVCQSRIGRSFSKQAYQCRDCKMVCHKSCHYKTDTFCTESSVSKLHIAKDVDWALYIRPEPMHEFISYPGL